MENGGRITGWLVQGDEADVFTQRFLEYEEFKCQSGSLVLAVGDGNHSLATAKACFEELKQEYPEVDWSNHPARYALVELENIHDEAQEFEPIHRLVTQTNVEKLLGEFKKTSCSDEGIPIVCYAKDCEEVIYLKQKPGQLAIGVLQKFLDDYLKDNVGEIDYIHGDDVLRNLTQKENAVGFLVPVIEKAQLFSGIECNGVLPRKTFSMGHAEEKRYYLECRKIK